MKNTSLAAKQLAFSSKYNVDIYEFQYGGRRKPRSDRGKKRSPYQKAKETAGNVAKYGAGIVAADQIFVGAPKLVKKGLKRVVPKGIGQRVAKINPKSVVGRGAKLGRYAVGLAIGDQAVRAVNRGVSKLKDIKSGRG
jgi:hypothetical protein